MSGDVPCSEFLTWISIFALQKHTKTVTLGKRHKHVHEVHTIFYFFGAKSIFDQSLFTKFSMRSTRYSLPWPRQANARNQGNLNPFLKAYNLLNQLLAARLLLHTHN